MLDGDFDALEIKHVKDKDAESSQNENDSTGKPGDFVKPVDCQTSCRDPIVPAYYQVSMHHKWEHRTIYQDSLQRADP